MRVLHLTSNDAHTGGAAAVERLHRHLLAAGQDSLVAHAGSLYGYPGEVDLRRGMIGQVADKVWRLASDSAGGPSMWRPSWRAQGRKAEALRPDVVHVHWTYGMRGIPLSWVCGLSRRMPVVWTMHDMWAITGGCTNPQGCERWRSGCGSCPQIAGDTSMEKSMEFGLDATAWLWRRKRYALERARLGVVAPSKWMHTRLEASGSFAPERIAVVPNVVDTDVFAPRERESARAALGIEPCALVVLFAGKPDNVTAYRGRYPIMLDVLSRLRESLAPEEASKLVVLLVGAGGEALAGQLGAIRSVCAGRVESEAEMSRCFAASDVYLNTTQYDNFPAIVQESLSCGVPVVASVVGGIPEMVVHGETGMLAQPQDSAEFTAHLRKVLVDHELRGRLTANARLLAQERFSPESVLPAMLDVYRAALAAHWGQEPEDER
jgi:glycosyltransferase involved in cell wall biosynthesis